MNSTQLHSRYNPQVEAVRYINSLNLKDDIKCFILIEPGLGYMIPVLREKFKDSRIISLHVEDHGEAEQADFSLICENHAQIQVFLESHIEHDAEHIKIIEWRPSLDHYMETYADILCEVVKFIKRIEAGKRTQAVFGKRWVKNFFKNLNNVNASLLYKQTSIPVIVAGSGPGLENCMPVIKKAQDTCLIIAASSSLLALQAGGVDSANIDIVIATDGGNWALFHLYPFFRAKSTALALNLCAALPSQARQNPMLLINDGSYWQSIILHELALPSVIIGQRGTVTATALELALALSSAEILLAGMDFAVHDIRTHAKPYSFDTIFFNKANRLEPCYSQIYARSSLLKDGGSLDIYAQWFKTHKEKWQDRVYSIGTHNIFNEADESLMQKIFSYQADNRKKDCLKAMNCENSKEFRKRGAEALFSALEDPKYSQNVKQELNTLLFPNAQNVTESDLKNAVMRAAGLSHHE